MIIEWTLGIIASLSSGLNIFQFIFWRAERQKMQAEAAGAEADARQKSINIQQDQFTFLQNKLTEFEKSYYDVVRQLHDSIDEKTELKKQISVLQSNIEAQNRHISELKKEIEILSRRFPQHKKIKR